MKIGIPRAMFYYRYFDLWKNFFENLGFEVVVSDETDFKIMQDGINYSIDENCLASKIFMGHVFNLIGKCDYIFIPRFSSYKNHDVACVKFNALYDICYNTFKNIKIITCDFDYINKKTNIKALFDISKALNISMIKIIKSYIIALKKYKDIKIKQNNIRNLKLKEYFHNKNLNILIIAHPYVYRDRLLGYPVVSYLKQNGSNVIFADDYNKKKIKNGWENYSRTIYFKYNKELLTGLNLYMNKIDGIIFLSVFPCGPDSIISDLCIRRIHEKPVLNLILDEQNFDAGVETRIESFMDILKLKKGEKIVD